MPLKSPSSASIPSLFPSLNPDLLPQHTKPSRDRVAELPPKQRARALKVAAKLNKQFNNLDLRVEIVKIKDAIGQSDMRSDAQAEGCDSDQATKHESVRPVSFHPDLVFKSVGDGKKKTDSGSIAVPEMVEVSSGVHPALRPTLTLPIQSDNQSRNTGSSWNRMHKSAEKPSSLHPALSKPDHNNTHTGMGSSVIHKTDLQPKDLHSNLSKPSQTSYCASTDTARKAARIYDLRTSMADSGWGEMRTESIRDTTYSGTQIINIGWDEILKDDEPCKPIKKSAEMALKPGAPPCLIMDTPAMCPKSLLRGHVPVSPVGNAWAGKNDRMPPYSPSIPGSPGVRDSGRIEFADPIRHARYRAILAEVRASAEEVKEDAATKGEQLLDVEADVVAAYMMLEEKNKHFEKESKMPVPTEKRAILEAMHEDEEQALVLNSIHHYADLKEPEVWLQMKTGTSQVTTVLDYARANLKMVRERKRSLGLEPSELACQIAFTTCILEEKIRLMKAVYEEEDSEAKDDGQMLKSVNQLVDIGVDEPQLRRGASASVLAERRNKGKAPSPLSLEAWAKELKKMQADNKMNRKEAKNNGIGEGN